MIAQVLPDLPAIDKAFDYLLPPGEPVPVGTIVRVPLHGRRVRGWVVGLTDEPSPGVDPKPVSAVVGGGPPPEVVALARWAAWRWAGRWAHLLRTASPPTRAPVLSRLPLQTGGGFRVYSPKFAASLVQVRRVGPVADRLPIVLEAVGAGPCIVVVPEVAAATRLAERLRREGVRVALLAGDVRVGEWEAARQGDAVVVGTRIAVWAPIPDAALRGIVVLDEHDEALQSEQAPTWHARDVAVERARRAGVPCTLVSPVPTLHALAVGGELVASPGGWPRVEVADRRDEDPVKAGVLSPRLAGLLRSGEPIVCVLNRLGRSRLLACAACGATAACGRCGAAVGQPAEGELRCRSCGTARPLVCLECGGGRFKNLRKGVARVREELEALVGERVGEVTAGEGEVGGARVVIGTEAVLHRLPARSVPVVAVLDLDQELLAPRYRGGELALALVARAARAVSDRVVVQTRLPDHPVVRAAALGDPGRFTSAEGERRRLLGYPPHGALAVVSGAAAERWAAAVPPCPPGVEVLGPADGRWQVRAPDAATLADWLATVPRPAGRLRIEVDPPRA